ncbi:MAG: hypothetical protein WC081_04780 [Candidatus Ratteibacteria bacterium]
MLPEEELAARVKELGEGSRRIAEDLRELRRILCPETDDPLVRMCDRQWDEYRQKAT